MVPVPAAVRFLLLLPSRCAGTALYRPLHRSNLYDVFVNIRDDELEHVKTMVACQDGSIALDLEVRQEVPACAAAAAVASAVPQRMQRAPRGRGGRCRWGPAYVGSAHCRFEMRVLGAEC